MGIEVEEPPCNTKTKTDCIRCIRKVATHRLHCPFPHQCNTTQRGLPWAPPMGKEPRRNTQLSHCCGSLPGRSYPDLAPWGLQGILQGSFTGNLSVMEKEDGLASTSIQVLADWIHIWRAQVVVPTNSFTYLHNSVSVTPWPGSLMRCSSSWFRFFNEVFCHP